MGFYPGGLRLFLALGILYSTIFSFYGCTQLGPRSISKGRASYNEAITQTDNEQLLMSIVRGRYGETYNMLAITAVAANIRFSANANAQVGIGPSENYIGNLVPLSSGVAYEENPTITYAPAQGAEFLRQLHSPVPLETLILLIRTSRNPGGLFTMMVETINGIRNPDFLPHGSKPDPRFSQFVRISGDLADAHVLYWLRDAKVKEKFYFVLTEYDPKHTKDVNEILSMLGRSEPENKGQDIIIPVYFALRGKEWAGIGITTRAPAELVDIMSACVHVPEEHIQSGVAITYPPLGLAGQGIQIRNSKGRPGKAWVAVKYRGYWFYIDETDQPTKRAFGAVSTMWQSSIAAGAEQQPAPILTLPVSR